MATFFLDLVNGNDGSAGTSWGTAWKTFTSGPTAARLTPGDEVRIAKSPDPTSLGSATWTSGKIGNSITFSSAPTKSIDPCKAGWVTMGAGSTVTNAVASTYITPLSFGSATVGSLQWVTSASANGALKDLGSTIDFSGNQQISFWLRITGGLDCTGAQNILIDLCSDAGATAVVTALTAPKWNYGAAIWYPIVIDFGSALSSTVRSVRIRTTSATSTTFFMDEMFASPAGGLTLWSLIGKNDDDWYPIRTCRDADVQLLASFAPGTAAGAAGNTSSVDAPYMGPTVTTTTYKRETIKVYTSSGPGATTTAVGTEAGTLIAPYKYSGGWDTSTGLQSGLTLLDNVTHNGGSIGISLAFANIWWDTIGIVRHTNTFNGSSVSAISNIHSIACSALSFGAASSATRDLLATLSASGFTANSIKSAVSYSGSASLSFTNCNGFPLNIGNMWGFSSQLAITLNGGPITIGNVWATNNSSTAISLTSSGSRIVMGDYKQCPSNIAIPAAGFLGTSSSNNNQIYVGDVFLQSAGTSSTTGSNNTFYIKSFGGSGNLIGGSPGENNVFNIASWTASTQPHSGASGNLNTKVYFHNYNGVDGYFRAYVLDDVFNSGTNAMYFELESTDVYTPGSKAVHLSTSAAFTTVSYGKRYDLKLASAAAEANKLVTITARVKRNGALVDSGIYIPGVARLVPGYTADIVASNTTTGSYELLTITFTPTAACVFDVMAYYTPLGVISPDIVWDALTISQAA